MNIQSTGLTGQNAAAMRNARAAYAPQAQRNAGETQNASKVKRPDDALRRAGQSFLNENPATEKTEGVVMELSRLGKEASQAMRKPQQSQSSERLQQAADKAQQATEQKQSASQARQAKDADGSVKKLQPRAAEQAEATKKAENAQVAKKDDAQIAKKDDAQQVPNAREDVKPDERAKAREEQAQDKVEEVTTERPNTNNLGQYNKKELMDLFLDGDISLKAYKEELDSRSIQRAQQAQSMTELATA